MKKIVPLIFVFISFSCKKKIDYNVYFSYGNFSEYPKGVSVDEGVTVISFPSIYGSCVIKLYPQSSVKFKSAFIYIGKPYVILDNFSGTVLLYSDNCVFEFVRGKTFIIENSKVLLRISNEKLRVEVLDGEVKADGIKIKKGQGFVPAEGYIYMMKKSVQLVFPRAGQKLYIPIFFWERGNESVHYMLEFALDRDFLKPIFYIKVKENKFFPEAMTLNKYSLRFFWKVWYEDESGAFSLPSQPEIVDIPTAE